MEKFFKVDGKILAINQDCSVTEFATLLDAFATNPICVLREQATYENVEFSGKKQQWYQNNRYILFSNEHTKAETIKVGKWLIKSLHEPRNTDTLHCDFVDPIGKIIIQEFKGNQVRPRLIQAFTKIREMNNYESALNYSLLEENIKLKNELARIKAVLAGSNLK